jgi:hypothetical protein
MRCEPETPEREAGETPWTEGGGGGVEGTVEKEREEEVCEEGDEGFEEEGEGGETGCCVPEMGLILGG